MDCQKPFVYTHHFIWQKNNDRKIWVSLERPYSFLSFTSSALGWRCPLCWDKVILNGKNPGRGSIDPAHNFTQCFTFTIKMLGGILSLLFIWGLTPSSQEKLYNDFTYSIFSLPLGHIINVIICKEGFLNARLYKWSWKGWALSPLSLKTAAPLGTRLT